MGELDDYQRGMELEDCLFVSFYPVDAPKPADTNLAMGFGHGLRFKMNPAEYQNIGVKFIIDPQNR